MLRCFHCIKHFLHLYNLGPCRKYSWDECNTVCAFSKKRGEVFQNITGCPWTLSCNCMSCLDDQTSLAICTNICYLEDKDVIEDLCTDSCCATCNCGCPPFDEAACKKQCDKEGTANRGSITNPYGCEICRCLHSDNDSDEGLSYSYSLNFVAK